MSRRKICRNGPDQLDRGVAARRGTAYFAATKYQLDDFQPLLYKTTDYGKTWKRITQGIPARSFTRVIREDPNRRGLLVAGTEFGIYVSFNGGENWQSFQLNLPVVPVTDWPSISARKNWWSRRRAGPSGFWTIFLCFTRLADGGLARMTRACSSRRTPTVSGGGGRLPANAPVGQNPPGGAVVFYALKDKPQGEVTIEFLDSTGKPIKKFSSKKAGYKA